MYLPLKERDEQSIMRSWECGLSGTVRARKVDANDGRDVIFDSSSYSEQCQAVHLANTDSFGVFTRKLQAFTLVAKKGDP